jgi:hypothetical protein
MGKVAGKVILSWNSNERKGSGERKISWNSNEGKGRGERILRSNRDEGKGSWESIDRKIEGVNMSAGKDKQGRVGAIGYVGKCNQEREADKYLDVLNFWGQTK